MPLMPLMALMPLINATCATQMGISSEFLRRRVLSAIAGLVEGEDSARSKLEGGAGSFFLHPWLSGVPNNRVVQVVFPWLSVVPSCQCLRVGSESHPAVLKLNIKMNDCRFRKGGGECTFRRRGKGRGSLGSRGHRPLCSRRDFPVRRVRHLLGEKGHFSLHRTIEVFFTDIC